MADRGELDGTFEALHSKAREMLSDPDLKASGLAAATKAVQVYAEYREARDKAAALETAGFRVPRPGVLREAPRSTIAAPRETVGPALGADHR